MATLPGCLCLFLTLWMVGSRQAAAIRTGSFDPDPWWGTKDALDIQHAAQHARQAGDLAQAEKIYQRGLDLARARHHIGATIRYLTSVGSCRLLNFQYRGALEALLEARRLAVSNADALDAALIDFNLSSLYLQAWDLDSALRAAEDGLVVGSRLPRLPFRHQLLLQLGRLHQVRGDGQATALLQQSIEASRDQSDPMTEAMGWDFLAEEWMRLNLGSDAERALDESFRIRAFRYSADLAFSQARLGELKLAQGDLESAGRLTGLAIAARARGKSTFPEYILMHQRGQIRLAKGDVPGALQDFSAAVDLVTDWRKEVLPAISILTATNVELERHVFDSFIETAAGEALRRNNRALSFASFHALALNRASSLRESLALSGSWHTGLPSEYWDVLGQLRAEQARTIREGLATNSRSASLRLKLTELEAEAGLAFRANQYENFRSRASLTLFQDGLGGSDLLLSFHLGEKESYRWAITRTTISLQRLPGAGELRRDIAEFRNGIQHGIKHGRIGSDTLGEQLYTKLLGGLTPAETRKHAWLLSLEDTLFQAPLAALVMERKGGKVKYLVEQHSLQVVPGALLFSRETGHPPGKGWFLGVGDAIYNRADPRLPKSERGLFRGWLARAASEPGSGQLNRLVASGSEVESSARSWHGKSVVLTGSEARRGRFLRLAGAGPGVIHLATHVLTPVDPRAQAMIAFGLDSAGETEFLTTEDIAMLRVPGAVVSMTGCATGAGDAKPGAGLLGLTRAWLTAGASAVVSTAWPVTDSNGDIFASFYGHLRGASSREPGVEPAEALARSQRDMIGSGNWRAAPAYWAAYQITGGAQ